MSNLNRFLFQKIVQDSLKFYALKRHELRSIIIPKVCQIKSTDNIKQTIQENAWRKGYEVGVLIPLSDCNYIQEELNSDQFVGVKIFTNLDIGLCKNIPMVKQVKDKVLKESAWFQRAKNCRSSSSLIPLETKILEEFENALLNGVDDRCLSLANPRLMVSDLSLLVRHEWYSLEVIEEFITKINAIRYQSKVLSFLALKELEKGCHLVERHTY